MNALSIEEKIMEIVIDQVELNTVCIRLIGRLDMMGSEKIDLRFTALTATDSNSVIVDMSGVDFIASIGMRLLLTCAKAKKKRGGCMLLVGLQPLVKEALETAGIDTLIPVLADESAALSTLRNP
jgi:anti-anti-sigma factor